MLSRIPPPLASLSSEMGNPLRVFYACGPGNVVESFRRWRAGEEVISETSKTYSGQFFDFCCQRGYAGYAVSSHGNTETLFDGAYVVENRPKWSARGGAAYHLAQLAYAIALTATALRWRADVAVVDSGTTHWALLAPLRLAGIPIVASLHNVPWPNGCRPTSLAKRLVLATDALFWRRLAGGLVSVSPECERQVRELAPRLKAITVQYRAQYRRSDFPANQPAPPLAEVPFKVMFAGRVERNKGVFDIVEIARLLEAERPGRATFEVCGDGTALNDLRAAIEEKGLSRVVRTLGRLNRHDLLKVYGRSHAVIVPTRSDFCEGLPMVCAEAILCGRPVITSRLSNAEDVLPGALLVAQPDDPGSYATSILQLLDQPCRYERLRSACGPHQEQFYDPRMSFAAALETVLDAFAQGPLSNGAGLAQ
jgi:glycosyltransferase involved in cell wall biosynthesis